MIRIRGAAAFLAMLGSFSCSEGRLDEGRERSTREREQFVIGGTPSDDDSVVAVMGRLEGSGTICSGTLLSPRIVITARHCVSLYTEGEYTCTIDGELDLSRPRNPANAGEMGNLMLPEDIAIHLGQVPDLESVATRTLKVLAPEADDICRNDIAILVLEDPLPGAHAKIRLGTGIDHSESVRVVGYGINEERKTMRKERSMVSILGVGPSEFFSLEGQAMPRTFVIESVACPGDSGGPAFSDETGEILGVFSLFRGECTSREARNFYTQIAPYEKMLREAFVLADSPWPEPDPDSEPPSTSGEGGMLNDKSDPEMPSAADPAPGSCTMSWTGGSSKHPRQIFTLSALVLILFSWRARRTQLPST